jgi:hypothetical protein
MPRDTFFYNFRYRSAGVASIPGIPTRGGSPSRPQKKSDKMVEMIYIDPSGAFSRGAPAEPLRTPILFVFKSTKPAFDCGIALQPRKRHIPGGTFFYIFEYRRWGIEWGQIAIDIGEKWDGYIFERLF